MKKYIIFIALFGTAVASLSAQVPGYQGKRGVVELQIATSPLIALASLSVPSQTPLPITIKLHGEYAFKRQRGIGLELHQLNYGSFSLSSIMLMYCRYNRDWTLAPYGRYANWGLAYNFGKNNYSDGTTKKEEKADFVSFHMNWGQRLVVAKRISLNYNFESSVPLSSEAFEEGNSPIAVAFITRLFGVNVGVGYLF